MAILNSHLSLQTEGGQPALALGCHSNWYSRETGIYSSIHPSVPLPTDPFLDVVSFVFSHRHNGISALTDYSSGCSISYSKLLLLVQHMAAGVHHMGVSKGDNVLLLLPNSVYFPIVFLGVLSLGAIVTTMNPLSSMPEIKKRILDCGVRLSFTGFEKVGELKNLGISAIGVPETVNFDQTQVHFSTFYDLISGDYGMPPKPVIRQQDTAAIMYSSGTTGVSKGVVLSHGNFIAMVELFVRFEASQYEYSPSTNVYLAVLPMFHIYGLSLFVLGLLSLGSSIVVMRKFHPGEVVKAIGRYRVTHFPAVPPILMALSEEARGVRENDFESLKQVSCGAAPLSRKCIDEFLQVLPHVDLIQGYGLTESTAVGTRGFNTAKFQKYSSVGLLAPNMQAKVVDWNSGFCMPPGSFGELWLRGPGIMREYFKNPEATMMTVNKDGWLRTGDIVCFDKDGYIHISDRIKEIIKYRGFQIAPADLEAILISHPEILDAAVTAAIDEERGEIPIAFVVRRPGSMLSEEAVINYVAEQVAPYKKVRKVIFARSIPKSAAGKILRRELKSLLKSKL
ncbi:hypothetical protein SLA2020_520610 [Shorea laevis]